MSFTRESYDTNAYNVALNQSLSPNTWVMDPYRNNQCAPCRPSQAGYIGRIGASVSASHPLVDVESRLRNLQIKNTKDPNLLYKPNCPKCGGCTEGYPCGTGILSGCKNCGETLVDFPECKISTEYTRFVNPPCTLKGVGINRFEPVYLDRQVPQVWEYPAQRVVNTKLDVKDTFVPRIPKQLDQTGALPTGPLYRDTNAPACRLAVTGRDENRRTCLSQQQTNVVPFDE
jgi:hypothetical protein